MRAEQLKKLTTKETLSKAFNEASVANNNSPRLYRTSMLEALTKLGLVNSTIKVSSQTLESMLQWID